MHKKRVIKIATVVIGIFIFGIIMFLMVNSFSMNRMVDSEIEEFISEEFTLVSHRIVLNNVCQYIFIKKIYDGGLDLYYSWVEDNPDLYNCNNELYFVGFDDERIIQIQERLLVQTLTVIFKDCDCVLRKINTSKLDYYYYKYSKLLSFFSTYDECYNPGIALNEKQKRNKAFNP